MAKQNPLLELRGAARGFGAQLDPLIHRLSTDLAEAQRHVEASPSSQLRSRRSDGSVDLNDQLIPQVTRGSVRAVTRPSHFSPLVLVLTSFPVLALADEGPAVRVVSKPEGGLVALDEKVLGASPLDVKVPPGKHTLTVSLPGYSTFKKVLNKVTPGERIFAELKDLELEAKKKAVAQARKSYEKANAALEGAQSSGVSERALAKAEAAMEAASEALEAAEKELTRLENLRASPVEKAAQAQRSRELLNAAPPRGAWDVFCAYDIGARVAALCFKGSVASARARCAALSKTEGASSACRCDTDPQSIAAMCPP